MILVAVFRPYDTIEVRFIVTLSHQVRYFLLNRFSFVVLHTS